MSSKQVDEYRHPTDYVVIPNPVRDRLWARFQASERRVKFLEESVRLLSAALANLIFSEDR